MFVLLQKRASLIPKYFNWHLSALTLSLAVQQTRSPCEQQGTRSRVEDLARRVTNFRLSVRLHKEGEA